MAQVTVVTDSTSDLSKENAIKNDISVIPLSVIHKNTVYLDGIDITPETFYPILENTDELPTTSQPSPGEFEDLYQKLLESGKSIVSFHISKGLSSTVESALSAAKKLSLSKIHVVDSGFISYALAFQALEAARLAKEGFSAAEILDKIARLKKRSELLFTLDTMYYLYKGGRIGKVSSLMGNLLGIKPVVRVEDGIYVPVGKARSIKQAMRSIVEYLSEKFGKEKVYVAVGHGRGLEYSKVLKEMISQALNICGEISPFEVGPVIGVHTGPGTVGIAVIPVNY